jgi:hypothetical protein
MRQILIVHGSVDERFEVFFSKVFRAVAVKTVWETYKGLVGGATAKDRVQREIQESDALFFVLSTDEEVSAQAKNWFPWATTLAQGKDIWVFEHCEDLKRVPILIPNPGHYVAYYITNAWCDYVTKIAEIYEKPKAAGAVLPEALLKPLTPVEESNFFDPSTGFALFDDSTARPAGSKAICPACSSAYDLHVPSEMKAIRCPSCGRISGIQQPSKAPVPAKG